MAIDGKYRNACGGHNCGDLAGVRFLIDTDLPFRTYFIIPDSQFFFQKYSGHFTVRSFQIEIILTLRRQFFFGNFFHQTAVFNDPIAGGHFGKLS